MVTASLPVAGALAETDNMSVLLLGGRVRSGTLATVDHWTTMLAGFVVDLAYIGANGISREHGLTTPDPAVSEVKTQAVRAARRTVFAGVHTKFGAVSFCRFADMAAWEFALCGRSTAGLDQHPAAAVEASLVWQWTPFMMLILLAGLQSRDQQQMEAARVDGASNWQIFRYLTLPHLRRYLELGALLGSIYIVQNFDAVFTITSGGLGTANLPYTVYQSFYQAHENGLVEALVDGVGEVGSPGRRT
ncbi:hypothetical protein SALBM311S_12497 [Streptomyces alboniger]